MAGRLLLFLKRSIIIRANLEVRWAKYAQWAWYLLMAYKAASDLWIPEESPIHMGKFLAVSWPWLLLVGAVIAVLATLEYLGRQVIEFNSQPENPKFDELTIKIHSASSKLGAIEKSVVGLEQLTEKVDARVNELNVCLTAEQALPKIKQWIEELEAMEQSGNHRQIDRICRRYMPAEVPSWNDSSGELFQQEYELALRKVSIDPMSDRAKERKDIKTRVLLDHLKRVASDLDRERQVWKREVGW